MSGGELAERQAALIASLVAGGPLPPGFDPARLAAVRRALLRKRAGAAAAAWPLLAASLGSDWVAVFSAHHDGRPPSSALRDGWDVARASAPTGHAAAELAEREAFLRYDGRGDPVRRSRLSPRRVAHALRRRRA